MAIDPRDPFTGEPASSAAEDPTPHRPEPWPAPERPVEPATTLGSVAPVGQAAADDRQAALRALRNLEATEARLERNARREAEEARGKLVEQLLPVLDNLDRTIRAAETGRSDPAMVEGVRMVRQQLENVLRGYGVERVEALGQRFDPTVHDAVSMVGVSDPERHGAVVHQIEPGYRFGARLLRPAKVSVGRLVSPYAVRQPVAWR